MTHSDLPFGAVVERPDSLALNLVEIPLVKIPAGEFLMGSPLDEAERYDDEGPQHVVTLGSFFLSQTPITQAQWREVAGWRARPGENWGRELEPEPSFFQPRSNPNARSYSEGRFSLLERETDSDQRPVDNVGWLDAMEFCNRLSQRTGRHCTLPSEAQWEYACRAGTSSPFHFPFHFGATITSALVNYDGNTTYADGPEGVYRRQTTPVGMFPANAWGLHDMHGNVWEWCLDHWHDSYEGAPTDGSAWLNDSSSDEGSRLLRGYEGAPTDGSAWLNDSSSDEGSRLLRGGAWYNDPGYCRSAHRAPFRPELALDSVGFRVVCLPQGPSLNA
jgi:formylglycine-generating enzyme required for sulfatase activity